MLAFAIEREFPSLSVEQVYIGSGLRCFRAQACLILVDTEFLAEIDLYAGELTRLHPAAPVAVWCNMTIEIAFPLQDVFASKVVRGVLPMDLKLDVWLSVIRLMLRGGEYFPFAMFQSYVKDCSVEAPADVDGHLPSGEAAGWRR